MSLAAFHDVRPIRLAAVVPCWTPGPQPGDAPCHASVLFSFCSAASACGRTLLTHPLPTFLPLLEPHQITPHCRGPRGPAHPHTQPPSPLAPPGLWACAPAHPSLCPDHSSRLPFCQAHPQKPSEELFRAGPTLPGVPDLSLGSSRGDIRLKATATVRLPALWSNSSWSDSAKAWKVTMLHEVASIHADGLSPEPPEP